MLSPGSDSVNSVPKSGGNVPRKVTRAGYERLYARRQTLDKQYRQLSARDRSTSYIGGSDRAGRSFDGCEHEEDVLRAQITEIDLILTGAKIIDVLPSTKQVVGIGDVITIAMSWDDGARAVQKTYRIDGYAETVPAPGPQVVGYHAPLISPLMGLCVGESCTIELNPQRDVLVTILERRPYNG